MTRSFLCAYGFHVAGDAHTWHPFNVLYLGGISFGVRKIAFFNLNVSMVVIRQLLNFSFSLWCIFSG